MKKKISIVLLILLLTTAFFTCESGESEPANKWEAIAVMRDYITQIAGHEAFKGKIYSWDVLNEVFPDGNSSSNWKSAMRQENPWFKAIGSDFVYYGFLAARLADPDAILYYNDYNTDQSSKATLIRNMVRDVNNRYLASEDKPEDEDPNRLLIEGIGMQEHHNTNVSANAVRSTINMFRPLGVKLAVTELDVLAQGYNDASSGRGEPASGNNLTLQAQRYGEYFRVYLENKDIIERISFWGVTDNQSWRSAGQPLIFDANGKAKPAYDKIMEALGIDNSSSVGVDILSLPPLKDTIGEHFTYVGNIFNPPWGGGAIVINDNLKRHFNILTAENHMKPGYLVSSINGTTITLNTNGINTAKNMVDAAIAADMKIVGHTLLWHSQNPSNLKLP